MWCAYVWKGIILLELKVHLSSLMPGPLLCDLFYVGYIPQPMESKPNNNSLIWCYSLPHMRFLAGTIDTRDLTNQFCASFIWNDGREQRSLQHNILLICQRSTEEVHVCICTFSWKSSTSKSTNTNS